MEGTSANILSREEKRALTEQYLTSLKQMYPEPIGFDVMYNIGVAANAFMMDFHWETICTGPFKWQSFARTTLHQKPEIYLFFSAALKDFLQENLASHLMLDKHYLLRAAASLVKYVGMTYEGEERKLSQISAIKRGFGAINLGITDPQQTRTFQKQLIIAKELNQDQEALYYTCCVVGKAMPSDIVHNYENKVNDWASKGRDFWKMAGATFASSLGNNRNTNLPSNEFFSFLAGEMNANCDPEFLSRASAYAWMIRLLQNIIDGNYEQVNF